MPKHFFLSLSREYTLVIALASARNLPNACQGNYFLQIGKNTCKNFILFGGLYFDAIGCKIVEREGNMKTYIMLVITLTLVNIASRSPDFVKIFDLP